MGMNRCLLWTGASRDAFLSAFERTYATGGLTIEIRERATLGDYRDELEARPHEDPIAVFEHRGRTLVIGSSVCFDPEREPLELSRELGRVGLALVASNAGCGYFAVADSGESLRAIACAGDEEDWIHHGEPTEEEPKLDAGFFYMRQLDELFEHFGLGTVHDRASDTLGPVAIATIRRPVRAHPDVSPGRATAAEKPLFTKSEKELLALCLMILVGLIVSLSR